MSFNDVASKFSQNDNFIIFGEQNAPNNEFQAVLLDGFEEVDPFGTGPEDKRLCMRFKCEDGKERLFTNKSKRFAKAFVTAGVELGDTIRVTRIGKGFQIAYDVKVIKMKEEEAAAGTTPTDPLPF